MRDALVSGESRQPGDAGLSRSFVMCGAPATAAECDYVAPVALTLNRVSACAGGIPRVDLVRKRCVCAAAVGRISVA